MPETFQFELVSPEKRLMDEPARMVVVPGEEGDMGVLVAHSPVVTTLRFGVVEVHREGDSDPFRVFVSGGFADISAERCTVLAEEAVPVKDMDQSALEQSIANLNEDLGMVDGVQDRMRVERNLALAKAKLQAVTGQLVA